MNHSFIKYYSEHEGYKCGYCKRPDTNYSHVMWAHAMTVTDYQDLIDRGWRRSGKQCYKPTLEVICCPMYTIRCRALEFKASKSQKKVLKSFNKFLIGEEISDISAQESREDVAMEQVEGQEQFLESKRPHEDVNIAGMDIPFIEEADDSRKLELSEIETKDDSHMQKFDSHQDLQQASSSTASSSCLLGNTSKEKSNKVTGADPTKAPCKKAKQARRERMLEKLQRKGINVTTLDNTGKNTPKTIEDIINELPDNVKSKLEIKLVRTEPPSPEWLATKSESHEVYVKYQTIVHGDKPEKCTEPKFHDFLVHSPLLEEYSEVGPPCGYGSFHQQYWLDGKIIAVGVIDILPKCISSVYFFYDPQYLCLSLGTYGALREIAFTRQLQKICPNLKYYNMGFYIHTCTKMRYKGKFHPSDLLCPETFKWFPIKECIAKLEISKYSRFDPDLDGVDENYPTDNDVNNIKVLSNGQVQIYKVFKRKAGRKYNEEFEVLEYARLVGGKTARSIIMVM
ncbi:arginyl-tRNA-protein transferase 1 isoform 1 [Danaus plexippus plexippus]|uniref:Arginyl-tRNA--protein transferase 1 n=1 Tax=Danaus plexippus plexippus TaxID=278856 RepID=A0A212F6U4_DANPL|nr:arginyl-tRNA-protein transferase 1 isoform 1 [Danaus plexippus plexippus]